MDMRLGYAIIDWDYNQTCALYPKQVDFRIVQRKAITLANMKKRPVAIHLVNLNKYKLDDFSWRGEIKRVKDIFPNGWQSH